MTRITLLSDRAHKDSQFNKAVCHAADVLRFMLPAKFTWGSDRTTHVPISELVDRIDLGKYLGLPQTHLTTDFLSSVLEAAQIPVAIMPGGHPAVAIPNGVLQDFCARSTPKADEVFSSIR